MKKILGNECGFILPAAVMLVFFLTISGTTFFHLQGLESLTAFNEISKHAAFYLANTGIERVRTGLKVSLDADNNPSWTPVLDPLDPNHPINYPLDSALLDLDPATNPNPLLCPNPAADGCVVPPFQTALANPLIAADGNPVRSPDMPFQGTFDGGLYSARIFNNGGAGDTATVDGDSQITLRALGNVRGVTKVIEVDIQATSGMDIIDCQNCSTAADCPNAFNENMDIINMDGREPASLCGMPVWNEDYYRDPDNLPCSNVVTDSTGIPIKLVPGAPVAPDEIQIQSDTCYYVTGDVDVKNVGSAYHNVIVFSDQALLVSGGAELNSSILIGLTEIQLQGNVTLKAPLPFPALITQGQITKGDGSVEIYGNIYAVDEEGTGGSIGDAEHPLNPNEVHGTMMGGDVYLKSAAISVSDENNLSYYEFMPGFEYPPDLRKTITVGGSWQEIQ